MLFGVSKSRRRIDERLNDTNERSLAISSINIYKQRVVQGATGNFPYSSSSATCCRRFLLILNNVSQTQSLKSTVPRVKLSDMCVMRETTPRFTRSLPHMTLHMHRLLNDIEGQHQWFTLFNYFISQYFEEINPDFYLLQLSLFFCFAALSIYFSAKGIETLRLFFSLSRYRSDKHDKHQFPCEGREER